MFIGEYSYSIDDKGRVALPVKFRSKFDDGCIITRGLDHCLWVYTKEEWEKLVSSISELPLTQKNARSFSRLMFSGAVEVKPDKIGRVNLPGYLKEYSNIKNKVVIAGVLNRLEIWAEDAWETFKHEMEENSDEVAEQLSDIGF